VTVSFLQEAKRVRAASNRIWFVFIVIFSVLKPLLP